MSVSESTAHRHIRKLQGIGVLQVKKQFKKGRQQTNRYTFPTPDWWIEPADAEGCHVENGDTLLGTTDERDVDALEDVEDVLDVGGFQHLRSRRCLPGERRRLRWTPLDRRSLFFTHRDITWDLVDVFENHLQARNIAEKGKPQTIPTRRRMKWIRSANDLLDDHPVEDVVAVLDIVFTRWDGLLPFPVINDYTGRVDPRLRRVTRLAQIIEDFPGLLAMVNEPAHLAEIIDPADAPDAPAKKPKAYYDRGEGFPMEDQVSELVELFTKTKTILGRQVSDYDLFAWRKTFRIMLDRHQIPYADIVLVVGALADRRLELDFSRYNAPYDLVRSDRPGGRDRRPGDYPREWVNILGWVCCRSRARLLRPQHQPCRRLRRIVGHEQHRGTATPLRSPCGTGSRLGADA